MKKFTTILCASLLIGSTLTTDALATRTRARPWLARKKATRAPTATQAPSVLDFQREFSDRRAGPTPKGDKIAQQALRYHGTRYRFGGDSESKGFDCSGLIRRVYDDLNMKKLPRTSAGLYGMGNPVRLNDLRPGDLVFFKNTYKRGISHVGVYAGSNKFIHAQSSRHGVTMTRLSDPYYQLHYAGARRLY